MKKVLNEIKCIFPALSKNEALARSIVTGFMLPLDPKADELADVRCAVSEAVTNCIVHAYRGTSGDVTLTLKIYDGRKMKITVADSGCGIDNIIEARKPLFTTAPDEDRCGMGFSIMESFSDKLVVLSQKGRGTRVTMTKNLSPSGDVPPT